MPTDAGRRSLLYLGCAVVLVDTLLYAALTPLLPRFTDELGLSKALAGILVAAYPFGALAGGVPGGIVASRIGPQRTVVAGLTVFCASTIVFAFANDFALLLGARIAEGVSSALTWAGAMSWLLAAAPRERRGELVGTALGAAVFGALVGPGLGAAAAFAGRGVVFTIVAAVGAVLIPLSLRETDAVAREHASLKALVALWRNRRFVGGLTLMAVTAMLFGLLTVIAPLHLADVGWSAGAIGAVWVAGAALETIQAPFVGRLSDRRGRLLPIRLALTAGAALSFTLAWVGRPAFYVPILIAADMAYGSLFTPGMALIADGAEDAAVPQGLAFGVMNASWAIGAVLGPAGGGALAGATGDRLPLLLSAGLCALGLVVVRTPLARTRAVTLARD